MLRVRTTGGREADLAQEAIDGLKSRVRGPLLLPGAAGYEESRAVWNAMIDRKPAMIVRCLGTADVIACVQFAREHDILLCIKGGGHNIAGHAVADGALMLDMSLLDATQPKGRRYYWKSEYLPRIEPAFCEKFIEHAVKFPSPHSAVVLFQLEGALNQLDVTHSPVGNRDAHHVLNITGSWEQAEDDDANIMWVRDAWNDLKPFSTGGTYINFLTEDEGPERTTDALGGAVLRLSEVKARWDPRNVFRANRNIAPA